MGDQPQTTVESDYLSPYSLCLPHINITPSPARDRGNRLNTPPGARPIKGMKAPNQ